MLLVVVFRRDVVAVHGRDAERRLALPQRRQGTVLQTLQVGDDHPRITASTMPSVELGREQQLSGAGVRAAAEQLHVAAAIDRRDRQTYGRTDGHCSVT